MQSINTMSSRFDNGPQFSQSSSRHIMLYETSRSTTTRHYDRQRREGTMFWETQKLAHSLAHSIKAVSETETLGKLAEAGVIFLWTRVQHPYSLNSRTHPHRVCCQTELAKRAKLLLVRKAHESRWRNSLRN